MLHSDFIRKNIHSLYTLIDDEPEDVYISAMTNAVLFVNTIYESSVHSIFISDQVDRKC